MKSELLHGGAESPPRAPALPRVGEAFDPYLTGGRPAGDTGTRHAAWTLAQIVRPPVRDLIALSEPPLEVLVVGAAEGWLALQLLAWGAGTVTVVDARAERLQRLLRLAEATAADPRGRALRTVADISQAGAASWHLALLDGREGMPGARPPVLEAAAAPAASVLLLSDDRIGGRRALAAAGCEPIRLLQPPTDAERRFVKLERVVLEGRSAVTR